MMTFSERQLSSLMPLMNGIVSLSITLKKLEYLGEDLKDYMIKYQYPSVINPANSDNMSTCALNTIMRLLCINVHKVDIMIVGYGVIDFTYNRSTNEWFAVDKFINGGKLSIAGTIINIKNIYDVPMVITLSTDTSFGQHLTKTEDIKVELHEAVLN